MAEPTAAVESGAGAGQAVPAVGQILRNVLRPDIGLPLGLVAIMVVLIMPMPSWMLDIGLSMSLAFSVVILMTALYIERPLDFSSFPTVLLISTMLRLALNLASTRVILTHGHEGAASAGHVIEAFGHLVMSGNFVIGIIVFAILTIVNFVVITKGSGRIAEVTARFTLDAMPGKQMAIDADLSAGLINEVEARERRRTLENESSFFGAMDGAAKFVRGDAIAGLLITVINIVAGMIIGVAQKNLAFTQAAQNYTLLTIGDGLVSQIPALLVSIAAGMLVTKASSTGRIDRALFAQFSTYPKALGLSSFLLATLALLPGIPALPFLALAGLAGSGAYFVTKRTRLETAKAEADVVAAKPAPADEPIATALHMDLIRLELGYGLLPLIHSEAGQHLTSQIKALRRQIAGDMGFVMPSVRIQDNMQLPANTYCIRIKEIEAGRGDLRPTMLLTMDPRGDAIPLAGEDTMEPTFGLPAKWIDETNREEALFRGYTVVEPATVITTHLTEIVKDHMSDLLSYAETQKLLDDLDKEHQKLVADVIPSQVSLGTIQRVLQALLAERISIRDLPTIIEAVSEAVGSTTNVIALAEHARQRIARQICEANLNPGGSLPLVALSPEWEQAFTESIVGQGDERRLALAPSRLHEFIAAVRRTFERHAMKGETPVLLTSPGIRPYVRSIVERFRPATVVMSQAEIHPKIKLKTLEQI